MDRAPVPKPKVKAPVPPSKKSAPRKLERVPVQIDPEERLRPPPRSDDDAESFRF